MNGAGVICRFLWANDCMMMLLKIVIPNMLHSYHQYGKLMINLRKMEINWLCHQNICTINQLNIGIKISTFSYPWQSYTFHFFMTLKFKIRKEFKFDGSLKIFIPNFNDYLVCFYFNGCNFFSIIWSILLYSSWGLKRSMGVKKSCISWIQTRVDF